MKPEEIIELAKKAECGWLLGIGGFPAFIEHFAALHREALIASGELVPRENVEAQTDKAYLNGLRAGHNSGTDQTKAIASQESYEAALASARSQP